MVWQVAERRDPTKSVFPALMDKLPFCRPFKRDGTSHCVLVRTLGGAFLQHDTPVLIFFVKPVLNPLSSPSDQQLCSSDKGRCACPCCHGHGFMTNHLTFRSAQLVNHLIDTYQWPLCNAWHRVKVLEPDTKMSRPRDPNLRVALEEN